MVSLWHTHRGLAPMIREGCSAKWFNAMQDKRLGGKRGTAPKTRDGGSRREGGGKPRRGVGGRRAGGAKKPPGDRRRSERGPDQHRFRANVAMVIQNDRGQVLWARRVGGGDAWQFPQGGIQPEETPDQALYRELREEVGLPREAVEVLAKTESWYRYRVPAAHRRPDISFVGQQQRWYLLRLLGSDESVNVAGENAEFDAWRWVSYWYPMTKVVDFKREVYRQALRELAPALWLAGQKPRRAPTKQRFGRDPKRSAHR